MTHPVKLLRALLQKSSGPVSGVVQSIAGPTARVRTSSGIVECPLNGVSASAGQRVALSSAGVTGVMLPTDAIQVYEV